MSVGDCALAIDHPGVPGLTSTVGTAVGDSGRLDTVAQDAASAGGTFRRDAGCRTFETVEGLGETIPADGERLVVVVAAGGANRHVASRYPLSARVSRERLPRNGAG